MVRRIAIILALMVPPAGYAASQMVPVLNAGTGSDVQRSLGAQEQGLWRAKASGPEGRIRVTDGDSLEVGGVRVRLHGIDAPEHTQTCDRAGDAPWNCGAWVTDTVRAQFDGAQARCAQQDIDRYGRIVARCDVDGQDMAQLIVAQGLAFAYVRFSDRYVPDEAAAKRAGLGLHVHKVEAPGAFRSAKRLGERRSNQGLPSIGCRIKGNISRRGEKIYHMPGQEFYENTRISLTRGERLFCSEADARAAGWRKAKR